MDRDATTWSPAPTNPRITLEMAAMPEAMATAASPPSSAATFSSSALIVGLPYRV